MDHNVHLKSNSFFHRNRSKRKGNSAGAGHESENDTSERQNHEDASVEINFSILAPIFGEIDQFLEILSAVDRKSDPPEVPKSVDSLFKLVKSMIAKFDAHAKFGQNQDEDLCFLESVNRISILTEKLSEFPSNSAITTPSFNRASNVLHRAMSVLDYEFRALLEHSKNNEQKPLKTKQSSFNSLHESETESSTTEEEFPAFSPEMVTNMNKIATTMISAHYETECCMAYSILRRNAFKIELNKLGFDIISIDDVQRMQWELIEGEISTWIATVKHCSSVVFPGERKLCDSVFSDHPSISHDLFSDFAQSVAMKFLNFAEALVLTKRSAEKLFKFLDMYEALRDFIPAIDADELIVSEASAAKSRLGDAAASIFCDLENSIKSDHSKTPVPSGAVHPLTRYTMNYLKYACEYKQTLEQIFQQFLKFDAAGESETPPENDDTTPKTNSPFSMQLMTVMDLLNSNLEMKSKLYRDLSLRNIFLMNNGRYIVQKIKTSTEIYELVGDNWYRKRSSGLRNYHKNYQRETWGKLLQCLSHEGLQVNGKSLKPVLKERFKSFNAMFDEIHKTQSAWVVSDEQLQSELRVSISAVVIPAYRSFLGRFKQYFSPGRQTEKYVKYQPEDIETSIDELFDGNPTSMGRRKT